MFTVLETKVFHRFSCAGAVAISLVPIARPSLAQTATATPIVQGVVYDSLRGAPLAGAFVTVPSVGRSTMSDVRGHFRFDSLAPGTYTFAIQHDVLDSIGVGSITTRTSVHGVGDEVMIAVPSFAALWRRWCQSVAPKDTGLVHGTVRDLSGRTVARASVEVSWTDFSVDGKALQQRGKRAPVVTDADGNFALCGVPAYTSVQLRASLDSASSGTLDVTLSDFLVARRDLRVTTPSQGVGIVAGLVTQSGRSFAGARVIVGDRPELRTGADGKFVVRDVPVGTRQVEILAVGMTPGAIVVDVPVRDTALVTFDMQKVVALPGVKVAATAARKRIFADIDDRRREGLGHVVDSTEIGKYSSLTAAFGSIPFARVEAKGAHIDRVMVDGAGGPCEAAYLVDGMVVERGDLGELTPQTVVAIEFYRSMIPHEMAAKLHRRPGCAVVAFWTRRFAP